MLHLKGKYTYHTLVPDDGHPLLGAVDALGDQAEVVFAHGPLGGVEGTVGAARHLQVTTTHTVKMEDVTRGEG